MGSFETGDDSRIEEVWRDFTDTVIEGMTGPQGGEPNDDQDSGAGSDREPRKPIQPEGTQGTEVEIVEPVITEAYQISTGGISQAQLRRENKLRGGGVFHSSAADAPGGYHGS